MSAAATTIVRHVVLCQRRWDGTWHIHSSHRHAAEAQAECARRKGYGDTTRVGILELTPNARIARAGVERADALLTDLGDNHYACRGTAEEIIAAGLAEPYMFENLGKSRTRTGCDEFGDCYRVTPISKTRYELSRHLRKEPGQPHANCRLPPGAPHKLDDVDVWPLLARFYRACRPDLTEPDSAL